MRPSSMVALSLLSFVVLSASRCADPASAASSGSLSIVAYNVKSLFDEIDDGTEFREFSVAKGSWDEARYKARLANVAAAVLAAAGDGDRGPDLLCLEEIENGRVLEALRSGPLRPACYRYAAIAPAEGGPFSVCALSRLPILASSCHSATTPEGRAGRDILELELDSGGGRHLVVLACHWKSKLGGADATEEARRATAALVRDRVQARLAADPLADIVVCGDFNESPDEYLRVGRAYPTAFMPADAADSASSTGLEDWLLVASDPSGARAGGPEGGECVLFSPWAESGGYSYSYRGDRQRLDGFLISPGLLDGQGLCFERFAAATAAFLMDGEGNPKAWAGSSGYSDHLPILLVLKPGA